MKEFLRIKYETPEIKVILVDKDIITESLGDDEILGPSIPLESEENPW